MSDLVPYHPHLHPIQPADAAHSRAPRSGEHQQQSQHAAGIRDYFQILRRQVWIVLPVFVAVMAYVSYRVITARPEYRANAVVRIADARRAITGGIDGEMSSRLMGNADAILSQIQILTSRAVVGQVVSNEGVRLIPSPGQRDVAGLAVIRVDSAPSVDSVRLRFDAASMAVVSGRDSAVATYGAPITFGGVTLLVREKPPMREARFRVVSREKAIQHILGSFRASPRPKTDVIDLSFTGYDPYYAQRLVNAIALTFQVHNATSAQRESRRRRIFIEEQMKKTGEMLHQAQAVYSNFRSRKQIFSSREKASAQQAGITTVEMERAKLDAERRTYEELLTQARRGQGTHGDLRSLVAAPGIAANPVIQQLYKQLSGYEQLRDSLIVAGAARTNPDVQGMDNLIEQTNARLVAAVRSQIQSISAQIASLSRLQVSSSADIARLPATEAEEVQLAQEVETFQKIAEQLQEEYQKARMAEAVEAGQVEIVDLADVPSLPVPGGRKQKIALGFLIAAALSVGAAVLRDGMNRSIAHRDDIERVLQVPGLGVVPRFAQGMPPKKGLRRIIPAKASNGLVPARRNGAGKSTGIADLDTSEGEAFRTIRTNLLFSQAADTLRTVVVTSASPSEGKSTTAVNIAAAFAHQGMRVLLLDCDLRKARIHRMFQAPRSPGLTEILLGRASHEDVSRQTEVTGLYVITAGEQAPNPAELLGGDRMRRVVSDLSGAYDIIILDTPPLLAASDAAVLATIADGVVLVVRAGSTEADAGRLAVQQLSAVGARIVGAVLNDPDSKVPLYGKYYSYEYYGAE